MSFVPFLPQWRDEVSLAAKIMGFVAADPFCRHDLTRECVHELSVNTHRNIPDSQMYPQAHVLTRFSQTALPHWPAVGVMLAALIAATGSATAQSRASAPSASNNCAIYGSGFVAIQGTGSCVRIGGRLRVEGSSTFGGSNFNRSSAAGFAGPEAGDGPARAHLRLEGPLGGRR